MVRTVAIIGSRWGGSADGRRVCGRDRVRRSLGAKFDRPFPAVCQTPFDGVFIFRVGRDGERIQQPAGCFGIGKPGSILDAAKRHGRGTQGGMLFPIWRTADPVESAIDEPVKKGFGKRFPQTPALEMASLAGGPGSPVTYWNTSRPRQLRQSAGQRISHAAHENRCGGIDRCDCREHGPP
jgi:hypothetical protein